MIRPPSGSTRRRPAHAGGGCAPFGLFVAIRRSLADDPERAAAFDREFREFARVANVGPPDGPAEYPYEYLLVVGRKRS